MNILVISEAQSKSAQVWSDWLKKEGYNVLTFENDLYNLGDISVVLALITIRDYVDQSERYKLFLKCIKKGLPITTNIKTVRNTSNKLLTSLVFEKNNIKHPQTYIANEINFRKLKKPLICKPIFGHSGNQISLLNSLDNITENEMKNSLFQEYIESSVSIRIICNEYKVFSSYRRISDGEIIENISRGAKREYFDINDELLSFSVKIAKALGGGLIGLDILEKNGVYYALEGNVPFGIDPFNDSLGESLVNHIKKIA